MKNALNMFPGRINNNNSIIWLLCSDQEQAKKKSNDNVSKNSIINWKFVFPSKWDQNKKNGRTVQLPLHIVYCSIGSSPQANWSKWKYLNRKQRLCSYFQRIGLQFIIPLSLCKYTEIYLWSFNFRFHSSKGSQR